MKENVKKLGACWRTLGKIRVPVECTEEISTQIIAVRNIILDVMHSVIEETLKEDEQKQEEERK